MAKVSNGEASSQRQYFGIAEEKLENLGKKYHQIQTSNAQLQLGQGFSEGFGMVESTVKEGGMNNTATVMALDILRT